MHKGKNKGLNYYCLILILILSSCQNRETAFQINNESINMTEVDNLVENQIYDHLYGIYLARKVAIEKLSEEKLFLEESKNTKLSKDVIITNFLNGKKIDIESFKKINNIKNIITDKNRPFVPIKLDTEEGKKILEDAYLNYVKSELIKSLKLKYEYKEFLQKPLTPSVSLAGIAFNEINKENSKVEVRLVSNFSCESCESFLPTFNKIVEKYGDKVYFTQSFLNFEIDSTTYLGVFSGKSGKFKDFYLKHTNLKSNTILEKLKILNLDKDQFKSFIEDKREKKIILDSFEQLNKLNITTIPTLIVNNKVYSDNYTYEKIVQYIDEVLKNK